MSFKGDDAYMKGSIPLELPGGVMVEARLTIEYSGKVTLIFENPLFAKDLMVTGLENRLQAMMLNYQYAIPFKRREVVDVGTEEARHQADGDVEGPEASHPEG